MSRCTTILIGVHPAERAGMALGPSMPASAEQDPGPTPAASAIDGAIPPPSRERVEELPKSEAHDALHAARGRPRGSDELIREPDGELARHARHLPAHCKTMRGAVFCRSS